jgi:hypothetical protein
MCRWRLRRGQESSQTRYIQGVTATIYRDGEQFKSSTSEGAYVIASADGTL